MLRAFRKVLADVLVPPPIREESKEKIELYNQIVRDMKACKSRFDSILDLYSRSRLRDVHILLQSLALDFVRLAHFIQSGEKGTAKPSLRMYADNEDLRKIAGLGELIDYCLQHDGWAGDKAAESLEQILVLLPATLRAIRASAGFRATGRVHLFRMYFENDLLRKVCALFVTIFIVAMAALLAFTCVEHFVFEPISTYVASRLHFDWMARVIPQQFKADRFGAVELDQRGQQFAWGHGPQSIINFFSPVDQKVRMTVSLVSLLPGQEIYVSANSMSLASWVLSSSGGRIDKVVEFLARKGENVIVFRYSTWNMKETQIFHNEDRPLAAQFYTLKVDTY